MDSQFQQQIRGFILGPLSRDWLIFNCPGARLKVYMRKQMIIIDDGDPKGTPILNAITVASANAVPQGTGAFKLIFPLIEKEAVAAGRGVFIESVVTPQFASFFKGRGYILDYLHSTPPVSMSFYKSVEMLKAVLAA